MDGFYATLSAILNHQQGENMAKNKAKVTESLIVSSKVKAAIKDAKCNTAGDALDGLNAVVYWYIEQAAKRAQANGRKTVRAHDFCIG